MVTVYFENPSLWSSYCEKVATFANEDLYLIALPALEKLAGQVGCIVTETMEENAG